MKTKDEFIKTILPQWDKAAEERQGNKNVGYNK